MKTFIILGAVLAMLLGGCSAKEMEDGANGMVNDVSNAFKGSKD